MVLENFSIQRIDKGHIKNQLAAVLGDTAMAGEVLLSILLSTMPQLPAKDDIGIYLRAEQTLYSENLSPLTVLENRFFGWLPANHFYLAIRKRIFLFQH